MGCCGELAELFADNALAVQGEDSHPFANGGMLVMIAVVLNDL
jgi:hypothetical protein